MNMRKTIVKLQALKKLVLADGKVDWNETSCLLSVVKPLAKSRGFMFEDYARLLEKCREDGKITPEESEKLAVQLDYLCSFFSCLRLKFWLAVTCVLLAVISGVLVVERVVGIDKVLAAPPAAESTQPSF